MNRKILRIASRNRQAIMFKLDRNNAIKLGHRFSELVQQIFAERHLAQGNHAHPLLLSQGLCELLVGDQRHIFGKFAQECPWLLLLFFKQQLELVVGDET